MAFMRSPLKGYLTSFLQPAPTSTLHLSPRSRPSSGRRGSHGGFNASPHNESLKPAIDNCYFSVIDNDRTGFVSLDDVVDYLDVLGCNGHMTLAGLEIHGAQSSVDLKHLTSLLEAEIDLFLQRRQEEEESSGLEATSTGVVRSGVRAAQAEVAFLRSNLDNAAGERDKLKSDLAEVHQRSVVLAQEIDDQHSRLEKVADKKMQ